MNTFWKWIYSNRIKNILSTMKDGELISNKLPLRFMYRILFIKLDGLTLADLMRHAYNYIPFLIDFTDDKVYQRLHKLISLSLSLLWTLSCCFIINIFVQALTLSFTFVWPLMLELTIVPTFKLEYFVRDYWLWGSGIQLLIRIRIRFHWNVLFFIVKVLYWFNNEENSYRNANTYMQKRSKHPQFS